jgi:hypothetical protein
MPFGSCRECDRYYVLTAVPSSHWRCRHCRQPLREVSRAESLARLRELRANPLWAVALEVLPGPRSGNPFRATVLTRRRA